MEPAARVFAAGLQGGERGREPRARQEVVDEDAEAYGTAHDGGEVGDEGARAEALTDDEDAGHVGGRACHEQYEGGTRREAFQHEGYSNGDRPRGADVHRDADGQYEEHRKERVVFEDGKERVGHYGRDECCNNYANNEPFANVLHHIDEGIAQGNAHFGAERHVGRCFFMVAATRSSGSFFVVVVMVAAAVFFCLLLGFVVVAAGRGGGFFVVVATAFLFFFVARAGRGGFVVSVCRRDACVPSYCGRGARAPRGCCPIGCGVRCFFVFVNGIDEGTAEEGGDEGNDGADDSKGKTH